MKEYSREEINTLWGEAYLRADSSNLFFGTRLFLFVLFLPVAFLGLPIELLFDWVFLSAIALVFAYYVRTIWDKSTRGKYSALSVILKGLSFKSFRFLLFWLFATFAVFSLPVWRISENGAIEAVGVTLAVYIVTIPLVFTWARRQTPMRIKGNGVDDSKGSNSFMGFMNWYFVSIPLILGIYLVILLPHNLVTPLVQFGVFALSWSALLVFIFSFKNLYLVLVLLQIGLEKSPYQATLKEVKRQIKEERKARQKGPTKIPGWCEGCEAQGEIEVDDSEGKYFVICEECGTETAQVWCDDSGAGGHFVRNIQEHPMEYDCEMCKKTHRLPDDFYEKPVALELIEEPRRKK